MTKKGKRNIGAEILEGIRQFKRGEIGRVITLPPVSETRARAKRNMQKAKNRQQEPEMRDEYDFSSGVRGKYVKRFRQGTNKVALDLLQLLLSEGFEQGADSIEMEYVPEGLEIMYVSGNTGVGTVVKNREEIKEIIESVVKMKRKLRGKQGFAYGDRRHKIRIEQHESFGEAAFAIKFITPKGR